ncbi:MAG: PhzF family phenazine biosynthesis protein, partial [Sphingobium sp.]
MIREFQMVDVFGGGLFTGNPVAVVAAADMLDTAEMLRITRWFNLSETTFLVPATDSEADYRVRIFTPDRELPFAGHPTLGTCHAWLEAGGTPRDQDRIVQQCDAGLIPIRRIDGRLAFAAPPLVRSGQVTEEKLAEVADFLCIRRSDIVEARWADNGPGWIGVILKDADAVLALDPHRSHPER